MPGRLSNVFSRLGILLGVLSLCTPVSAAKKLYVMDFVNRDNNQDYQYLEATLTESVRKAIAEKYEVIEPDRASVTKLLREGSLVFPSEFFNANVALQIGLLADQDVVLSGGFWRLPGAQGTDKIRVNVIILDIEKKRVVKRLENQIRVDGNIFSSIEALAGNIVREARDVLPNKGQFDFDRYAPISQTQLAILGGANLNPMVSFLQKNTRIDSSSRITLNQLGGPLVAAELRRDRFWGLNRLSGWTRFDAQLLAAELTTYVPGNGTAKAQGWAAFAEAGIGYQIFRHKRFFTHAMLGGGFFYSKLQLDYSQLKYVPADATSVSGQLYGPTLSGGLRAGFQLNPYLSWEIGLNYQLTFLQGATGGNLVSTMGIGFRI